MPEIFEEILSELSKNDSIYSNRVILFNDDHNSFDHVIECVQKICHKSERESEAITLEAHLTGKAVCYEGSLEACETVVELMGEEGLTTSVE